MKGKGLLTQPQNCTCTHPHQPSSQLPYTHPLPFLVHSTMNLSLYSIDAFIILDSDGQRVMAKYYRPKSHPKGEQHGKDLATLKEQKAFERGLWSKTKKAGGVYGILFPTSLCHTLHIVHGLTISTGDIILYDGHLAVYKHSLDLIMYFISDPAENELMLSTALSSLVDALSLLLRNAVEKRGVLENLDLVLLCLDETVDDGCVEERSGNALALISAY